MADRALSELSTIYQECGLDVVRFNFLYREKGSGAPDKMPRLMECFSAVVERTRRELSPSRLFIGGRSMGGRAGSMLAADGFECDGLLLHAYPLHPPGQPEKLRDAHLSQINVPVLCFNGTRDTFCTKELMEKAISGLSKRWTMHWVEGADHGFHVPKSSGRTHTDVVEEITSTSQDWISKIVR